MSNQPVARSSFAAAPAAAWTRAAAKLPHAMSIWLRSILLVGLLVTVGGCGLGVARIPPTRLPETPAPTTFAPTSTSTPTFTPAPVPTRLPTPLASARVTGQVCQAGATVYLRSCCPPYEAREKSDASGFFAFEGLTEGTFTVTCGLYSDVVTLQTYESQVDVDLCPPPTQPPLGR